MNPRRTFALGLRPTLVLGGVTDQTLILAEGNVRRCRSVSLVVRDDLNSVVHPVTDA
jgi:hypothetical protein